MSLHVCFAFALLCLRVDSLSNSSPSEPRLHSCGACVVCLDIEIGTEVALLLAVLLRGLVAPLDVGEMDGRGPYFEQLPKPMFIKA